MIEIGDWFIHVGEYDGQDLGVAHFQRIEPSSYYGGGPEAAEYVWFRLFGVERWTEQHLIMPGWRYESKEDA